MLLFGLSLCLKFPIRNKNDDEIELQIHKIQKDICFYLIRDCPSSYNPYLVRRRRKKIVGGFKENGDAHIIPYLHHRSLNIMNNELKTREISILFNNNF